MKVCLVRKSVGQHDHMFNRRLLGSDATMRFKHRFVEIRATVGFQRRQPFRNPFALADLPERQSPVPTGVEGENADLIRRIHDIGGRDRRGLGEIELGATFAARAHAAGLIEHEKQCHMGHLQARRRTHIDGKNPLQRRAKIAAGAVTLRTADHQQAAAQVAHVLLDRLHLRVRKLKRGNVVEHQKIVGRQLGQGERVRRRRGFDHRVTLDSQDLGDHVLVFRLGG